jgi:hypothetical protein
MSGREQQCGSFQQRNLAQKQENCRGTVGLVSALWYAGSKPLPFRASVSPSAASGRVVPLSSNAPPVQCHVGHPTLGRSSLSILAAHCPAVRTISRTTRADPAAAPLVLRAHAAGRRGRSQARAPLAWRSEAPPARRPRLPRRPH